VSDPTTPAEALTAALEFRGYWRHDYQNREHAERIIAALADQGAAVVTVDSLAVALNKTLRSDMLSQADGYGWPDSAYNGIAAAIIEAAKEAERE